MSSRLAAGEQMPETTITLTDGRRMRLPSEMGDGYRMILFFRGSW